MVESVVLATPVKSEVNYRWAGFGLVPQLPVADLVDRLIFFQHGTYVVTKVDGAE